MSGRIAYPSLEQVARLTGPTQSAIFGFPRDAEGADRP
jgi:hypothetical protein